MAARVLRTMPFVRHAPGAFGPDDRAGWASAQGYHSQVTTSATHMGIDAYES